MGLQAPKAGSTTAAGVWDGNVPAGGVYMVLPKSHETQGLTEELTLPSQGSEKAYTALNRDGGDGRCKPFLWEVQIDER